MKYLHLWIKVVSDRVRRGAWVIARLFVAQPFSPLSVPPCIYLSHSVSGASLRFCERLGLFIAIRAPVFEHISLWFVSLHTNSCVTVPARVSPCRVASLRAGSHLFVSGRASPFRVVCSCRVVSPASPARVSCVSGSPWRSAGRRGVSGGPFTRLIGRCRRIRGHPVSPTWAAIARTRGKCHGGRRPSLQRQMGSGLWNRGGIDRGVLDCGAPDCGTVNCGALECSTLDCGTLDCSAPDCGTVNCGTQDCGTQVLWTVMFWTVVLREAALPTVVPATLVHTVYCGTPECSVLDFDVFDCDTSGCDNQKYRTVAHCAVVFPGCGAGIVVNCGCPGLC